MAGKDLARPAEVFDSTIVLAVVALQQGDIAKTDANDLFATGALGNTECGEVTGKSTVVITDIGIEIGSSLQPDCLPRQVRNLLGNRNRLTEMSECLGVVTPGSLQASTLPLDLGHPCTRGGGIRLGTFADQPQDSSERVDAADKITTGLFCNRELMIGIRHSLGTTIIVAKQIDPLLNARPGLLRIVDDQPAAELQEQARPIRTGRIGRLQKRS